MKALVCEMCGSSDLLKQDGVFVCQMCGTKYSVEDAKKMMVDGPVEVHGSVRIDNSDELKKLYQAARNARETGDDESAIRHYEKISAIDPDSWEALFYLIVLKTNSIKNSEINSSAISVKNSLHKIFSLIAENVDGEEAKKEALDTVTSQCYETADWLSDVSYNFFKSITQGNGLMALTGGVVGAISSANFGANALSEEADRWCNIANIMGYCGNYIEKFFDMNDSDYKEMAVESWKSMLSFDDAYKKLHNVELFDHETLIRFSSKINKYEPSYEVLDNKKIKRNESKRKNMKACSIVALIFFWYPIFGLIFSIAAIRYADKPEDEVYKKRGIAGLVLNIICTIAIVAFFMSVV